MCNVTGIHPNLRDFRAIDLKVESRQCQHLLYMNIRCTRDLPHAVGDLLADNIVLLHVSASDLNIDRRRQPKVQYLGDNVCRLEEELHSRKTPRQISPKRADVVSCGVVVFCIQTHQDLRVAGTNDAGVAVRQVNARVRQANIVQNCD